MRYVLDGRYRFRGWHKAPTGILDTQTKRAEFVPRDLYKLLLACDGAHDIDQDALSEEGRGLIERMRERGVIRPAGPLEYLREDQGYLRYPARYRGSAHWSITGACNLRCRHCFMSAPHAKHGSPTREQLLSIVDQLAACGVFSVGITGGEPLIREDLWEVIDALSEREIGVSAIYTNGWLVDEALLDRLEERGMRPSFQLSFDGIGWHDFLRGVPGAEQRALGAIRLLRDRGFGVSVSMCVHRENRDRLAESVRLLASLGVRGVKCGAMMELGEWASPEVSGLQLTRQEELEMIEAYIPQYFADDAPVDIMLGDAFMYTLGDDKWRIYNVRRVPQENEAMAPSCGVLTNSFYIGADGMVAPCMGMCDTDYAGNFPNLFETPLREILRESKLTRLSSATVADVRDRNPKCRTCAFVDRCTGGCRQSVLAATDDYYGIDEDVCYFFENGWEERIAKAAEGPFRAYLKRNPPRKRDGEERQSYDGDPYL